MTKTNRLGICIKALIALALFALPAMAAGTGTTVLFNVADVVGPSVINVTPLANSSFAQYSAVEIGANVTDNVNISAVVAAVTQPGGFTILLPLNNTLGDIYNVSYTNTSLAGQYNVSILANDTSGNSNNTEGTFFLVNDVFGPLAEGITPANGSLINVTSTIEISANITDPSGVNVSLINITLPNGTVVSDTLTKQSGNKYNTSYTLPNLTGNYTITFIVNDSLGNVNITNSTFIGITETITPSVIVVSPTANSSYLINDTVLIQANVTDNVAVSTVRALIKFPDQTNTTLDLTGTGNVYNTTFASLRQKGNYTITIIATDSSGNKNNTESTFFRRIPIGNVTVEIISPDGTPLVYNETVLTNGTGLSNVSLTIANNNVKNVIVLNYNDTFPLNVLIIGNSTPDKSRFGKTWAFEGSNVNATGFNVTLIADGSTLYKCTNYTISNLTCNDNYIEISNLTRGSSYTVVLFPGDPGFGESSPDNGTPDAGGITAFGDGFSSTENTYISTQVDDDVFFTVKRSNGGGAQLDLGAWINLSYNLTNLTTTQGVTASHITNLTFDMRYCANDDVQGPFNCGGTGIGGTALEPMVAQILNTTSGQWQDMGVFNISNTISTERNASFNVSNAFTDFIDTNNFVRVRYEANVSINTNGNDAAFGIDYALLTVTFDNVAPNVSIYAPVNDTIYNQTTNVTLQANVSDIAGVNTVLVNVTMPSGDSQLETMTLNSTPIYEFNYTNTTQVGTYTWTILANDSFDNLNDSQAGRFIIRDSFAPNVTDLIPVNNTQLEISSIIEIGANISDSGQINTTLINITLPNGTVLNRSISLGTGNFYNTSFVIPNLTGSYNVTFIINDSAGNVNSTETTFFVGADQDAPAVVIVSPTNNTIYNQTFNVTLRANVTDVISVGTVLVNISQPSGDAQLETMTLNGSALYEFNYTNTSQVGTYTWTVLANDSSGNLNSTESGTFRIRDTTLPNVTDVLPVNGTVYELGSLIQIGANVTDNINVSNVSINITLPNGSVVTDDLSLSTGAFYNTSYTIPAQLGQYTVRFIANDTFDNINNTEITIFVGNDTIAPSVIITSPTNDSVINQTSTLTIQANVSDGLAVGTVLVNITQPSGASELATMTLNSTPVYEFNYTNTTLVGDYRFTILANDTAGRLNATESGNFTVRDALAPNVTSIVPVNGSAANTSSVIEIGATITDPSGINVTSVNITLPNGTVLTQSLLNTSSFYNTSYTLPNLTGTLTIRFFANDTAGNVNSTQTTTLTLVDQLYGPQVFVVTPVNDTSYNQSFPLNITANATDNINISTVLANVTLPNGSVSQVTLSPIGGDLFSGIYTTTLSGNYTILVLTNDTSGNRNDTESARFIVNDTTGPVVVFISPNAGQGFNLNNPVTIRVNATDATGVSSVYANITIANGSVLTFPLTSAGGDLYEFNFTNTTATGSYTIRIISNDTNGFVSSNDTRSFSVSSVVVNQVVTGKGGGSGGGSNYRNECALGTLECLGGDAAECIQTTAGTRWDITECTGGSICEFGQCVSCPEDWICTSWSSCDNGTQTRSCEDFEACGTERFKPLTTQTCEVTPVIVEEPKDIIDPLDTVPDTDKEPTEDTVPVTPGELFSFGTLLWIFLALLALLAGSWALLSGPMPNNADRRFHYWFATHRPSTGKPTPTEQRNRLLAALRHLTEPLRAVLASPVQHKEHVTEEGLFEHASEGAIYVPISYLSDANKALDILLDHDAKTAKKKIRRFAPLVNTISKKVLSEPARRVHQPDLDKSLDFISYDTFIKAVRHLAYVKRQGGPVQLPKASTKHGYAVEDGYLMLPEEGETPDHHKVTKITLKNKKSKDLIINTIRDGNVVLMIDIKHLADDMTTLKRYVKSIKHTAHVCGAKVVGLDEHMILVVSKGLKLHVNK